MISRNQQLIRHDFEMTILTGINLNLCKFFSYLPSVDVVVLSDYAKGTLRCSSSLINAARVAGKPVVVDPKGTNFLVIKVQQLLPPIMLNLSL